MSIENDYGELSMLCDECGDMLGDNQPMYHMEEDFHEMIDAAKHYGWLIRRNGKDDGWEHFCSDCRSGMEFKS